MRSDPARLKKLRDLMILDTSPDVMYDDITRSLAQTFDVPIALVNLLDAERDWFKSCIGIDLGESPAQTSFCEIFFDRTDDVIVIEDTMADRRFITHPLVIDGPRVRFYASARLIVDGQTVGTLCVYDAKPKEVTEAQREQLRLMGRATMEMLRHRQPAIRGA